MKTYISSWPTGKDCWHWMVACIPNLGACMGVQADQTWSELLGQKHQHQHRLLGLRMAIQLKKQSIEISSDWNINRLSRKVDKKFEWPFQNGWNLVKMGKRSARVFCKQWPCIRGGDPTSSLTNASQKMLEGTFGCYHAIILVYLCIHLCNCLHVELLCKCGGDFRVVRSLYPCLKGCGCQTTFSPVIKAKWIINKLSVIQGKRPT